MQAKTKPVQGTAWYCGEQVSILDVIYVAGTRRTEYMINYNGPVWVDSSYLNNIVWSI